MRTRSEILADVGAFLHGKALRFALFGAAGGATGSIASELIHDTHQASKAALAGWVGLWFGIIGCFIGTAITFAQFRYLRERSSILDALKSIGLFASGAGFVAGAVAQYNYTAFGPPTETWRVVCWAIAGGLLGLALSYKVPNLARIRAILGGGIGGAFGGLFFIFTSTVASQVLGRLLGIACIGFAIGMMLAMVETLFKKAWLELQYGPRETKMVLLGREPVILGSDVSRCTAYVPGAEPVACTFVLRSGKVQMSDSTGPKTQVLMHSGESVKVGRISVVVRLAETDVRDTAAQPLGPQPLEKTEWWRDFK